MTLLNAYRESIFKLLVAASSEEEAVFILRETTNYFGEKVGIQVKQIKGLQYKGEARIL